MRALLRGLVGAVLVAFGLSIGLVIFLDDAPTRHARLPDHVRPFRPLGIRVLNAVGVILDRSNLLDTVVPLDPDVLLRKACSKLEGPPPTHSKPTTQHGENCVLLETTNAYQGKIWHESFRKLTRSLMDANLTFLGRIVAQQQVLAILVTRGRLLEVFRNEDEKTDASALVQAPPPLFIVGLPRTGTTLLSRLLALDPQNRAPTLWECMDPVPKPPPDASADAASAEEGNARDGSVADRIRAQQDKLNDYKSLAPGLDALHPLEATLPEECIILMNYGMDSEQLAVTYPIHGYMEWLLAMDHHRDVLQWNRRVLNYMRHDGEGGAPPRRWILKTPYYLTMMDDIRRVHPNARMVHLHRDVNECIPSAASLIAKFQSIVTDEIDLHTIGVQQAQIRETMLEKALAVRKQWWAQEEEEKTTGGNQKDSFRILDVHLHELQERPIETLHKIYQTLFDRPLDATVAASMTRFLEDAPRTKHGRHRPTPADFGIKDVLDRSKVFAEYRELFGTKGAAAWKDHPNEGGGNTQPGDGARSTEL